jgi:hypothetical protein
MMKMQKTELFMGFEKPDGEVTEEEFSNFIETIVIPLFPDGLTILDADGYWNSPERGLIRERSKIVLILHDGMDESIEKIEKIRATYKSLFNQDSVLRVDYIVNVSF